MTKNDINYYQLPIMKSIDEPLCPLFTHPTRTNRQLILSKSLINDQCYSCNQRLNTNTEIWICPSCRYDLDHKYIICHTCLICAKNHYLKVIEINWQTGL